MVRFTSEDLRRLADAIDNREKYGTITAIRAAVKEMRDELRTIPTWTQYNRAC